MDPLTALGIAANVVQFLDFTSKLIGESKAIYQSVSGTSEDNIVLDIVVQDVQRLNDSIIAPEGCSDALKRLTNESDRISQEILGALDKLRVKGQKTRWKSFTVAIRGVWSQDQIESMTTRLGRLQAQTTAHLQVLIGNEVTKISTTMDHLKTANSRLGLSHAAELRGFRDELVQSIERVIQKEKRNRHLRDAPVTRLAQCINLEEVNGLPAIIARFHEDLAQVEAKLSNATQDYQILQTLYFDSIWARHDRITKAHSDTFTWIFKGSLPESGEPIKYVTWLREENDIFWIHGKPGSGKSTLVKFLVQHPKTTTHLQAWAGDQRLVVASFFFWNSGTSLQKSQEGLLRSLLFEIFRQLPTLVAGLYEAITGARYMITPSSTSPPPGSVLSPQPISMSWRLPDLLKAFEYLRGQEIAAKFCFFIDGLDEYKEEDNHDPRGLIRVLRGLAESPNIKLCLSSRPWTIFKDAFGSDPEKTLKLEDLTRKDIRRYVTDNFNTHEQFSTLSLLDPAYAALTEEVVNKAQGVFLWVFLVVRDLLDGFTYHDTIKTMRLRLDRFPDDLEAYFRHIFDSIPKIYRVQTARSFQIALSRDEPLPLITYSFVDDVEEDPDLNYTTATKLGAHQIEAKLAAMRRRLEGRSKGLLEVAAHKHKESFNCVVEFLHRTVRDFLLETPDIQDTMMGSLKNKYQTWVLLCRATSVMMKTWHGDAFAVCARHLCYFARLAIADSGRGDIVDEVFVRLFPARSTEKSTTSEADEIYRRAGLFDIGLASQYGLAAYVQKHLPTRLRLLEEESPHRQEGKKTSRLSRILRDALLGEDNYCKLSPELVAYLASLGASPNHVCQLHPREDASPIFYRFLMKLERREISAKDPAVLNIVETLVAHGADLDAKPNARRMQTSYNGSWRDQADKDLPRDVICKYFTIDEANHIFSLAPNQVPPQSDNGDVWKPSTQQQSKDGVSHDVLDDGAITNPKASRMTSGTARTISSVLQCFNCQQLGHMANGCKSEQVCAKCAGTGHHYNSCSAAFVKCVLCDAPHPSLGRTCPKLRSPTMGVELQSKTE